MNLSHPLFWRIKKQSWIQHEIDCYFLNPINSLILNSRNLVSNQLKFRLKITKTAFRKKSPTPSIFFISQREYQQDAYIHSKLSFVLTLLYLLYVLFNVFLYIYSFRFIL